MSPENTHKLIGIYMEVLILGITLQYMVSASLSCIFSGYTGLRCCITVSYLPTDIVSVLLCINPVCASH